MAQKIYDCVSWLQADFGMSGLVLITLGSAILVAIASYFLGCFNGAVIVSKYILRDDVRNHGSGNAGLTNFHRTFGGKLAAVVILCDVLKAVISVLLGIWILGHVIGHGAAHMVAVGKLWGGVFCLLGHAFPCMFEFKGGKGVLSGGAVAIMVDWRVALVVWGGFIVLVLLTRYVSLGSCWAGLTFPIAVGFVFKDVFCILLAAVCGVLLLWGHRGNIVRLVKGTESKFSLHRKKEVGQ